MKKSTPQPRRKPAPTAKPREAESTPEPAAAAGSLAKRPIPIVGIGASAGGLEALEQFLGHVPPASGLAFVVVQHLDPTRKGIMVELLQRATTMPVIEIKDQTRVHPDRVYFIPPNRDLSILHGVLHLLEPVVARGLRLPIDFFFRSLAEEQQEHSIGVILSGMGSDGTLGLRAIKEKAGVVFVQAPASAKCDGMPRSAIDAGLADVVARPEDLPGKILSYLGHVPMLNARPELNLADTGQSGLEKVVLLLRTRTGHDFTLYKKNTIYRRIERRMSLQQLGKISDYIRYLRENPQEADLLFNELLIGVTSFFRDPPVWEQLKTQVIPEMLVAHPDGGVLRAWVPACSTGEEAYSLAIVFREAMEKAKPDAHYSLQIFATDLDKDAINKARAGLYPANIAPDVGEARLRRFFVEDGRGYRVTKDVREMVIFAPQNVVMEPPFTRLDLLTCRNLLIYLETELQKRLLPLFHYSLNPGGILVLGTSETIGPATDLFVPLPGKTRLYRRENAVPGAGQVEFPAALVRPRGEAAAVLAQPPKLPPPPPPNLQVLVDYLLVQRYSPAAVLTTVKGDILYFSGKTGEYLEPPAGKANYNVLAMAREGLGSTLNEAFHRAIRQKTEVTLRCVQKGTDGEKQDVAVTVLPLANPQEVQGMTLITFENAEVRGVTLAAPKAVRLSKLGAVGVPGELQQARQELQTAREEMQASQEELKSANEEMQSINEELQSTNEELTTSKEEMQSMNEELQTTNAELRAKVEELSRTSDDMKNLFNSTDIATLFLDSELRVRRFTTQTAALIKLIPADAGRPITDIVSELDYPELADDSREVLRSLVFHERQISARDGRWFTVRIMPYRTQDNRIDGVVITFVNIAVAKALEATLRDALTVLRRRGTDEKSELDSARAVEKMLLKAQFVLEAQLPNGDKPQALTPIDSPKAAAGKG